MATKHNVNLAKAFAEIRQWPGARTDRKVFQVIAEQANDKGVAKISLFTIAMAIRKDRKSVYKSVFRLGEKGFAKAKNEEGIYPPARGGNPFGPVTFAIAPAYMLHTDEDAKSGDAKSKIADAQRDLAAAVQRVALAYCSAYASVLSVYAKTYDNLAQSLQEFADGNN